MNVPSKRNNVLLITGDPLGEKMAGPAIRVLNFAEQITAACNVRVLTTNTCELIRDDFQTAHVDEHGDLSKHEAWADVIVVQGNILNVFPKLQKTKKYLVCDLYDPMHLEQLEQGRDPKTSVWNNRVAAANHLLATQMRLGDFFLAASERQRDFWLGALATLGRVNGSVYEVDNTLENLIGIAPFGFPSKAPVKTEEPLRDVLPGIHSGDKVILWAGGIYNWFDPETLVSAVKLLSDKHNDVKLFFMGTQHPHPGVPEMEVLARTRALSAQLNLTDRNVFFNSSWVPYDRRQDYLLTANVGVSTHFEHVETRFSFRTRILDYLWAELPIVTTAGDDFARLVEAEGLGVVVPEQDVTALSEALEKTLFDDEFRGQCLTRIREVRTQYLWSRTAATLVEFCTNPHYAADRTITNKRGVPTRLEAPILRGPFQKTRIKLRYLGVVMKRDGLAGVAEIVRRKLRRG